MKLTLSSSPHQRVKRDTGQVMRLVIYAMVPGIITHLLLFGWGVLIQSIIAMTAALLCEGLILWLRKRPVERTLGDYSAVLTALLIAVSIPPALPWWMTVTGTVFAIAVAKQVYGGLGYNIFNPAMVAYVVLLISFPGAMTQWLPVQSMSSHPTDFVDMISLIFTGYTVEGYDVSQIRIAVDGMTAATPLDTVRTGLLEGKTYSEMLTTSAFDGGFFNAMGTGWGWLSLAWLAGGLFMIQQRVISWHIPGSLIAATVITASMLHLANADIYPSAVYHLFNGAVIIGAFFIATDPVSASTTPKGRLVFGAAIGFWIVIIRSFGGYPDAVAFSVLIMNMAVPLIDYYTRPRTYGRRSQSGRQR